MRLLFVLFFIVSCNQSGGGGNSSDDTTTVTDDNGRTCDVSVTDTHVASITFTGDTVGNCAQPYTISSEGVTSAGSPRGWILQNSTLTIASDTANFTTGGAHALSDPIDYGMGLTYTGVDSTTCQNASSINGTSDHLEVFVTGEFDSDCNVQLKGTFREYSLCVDNSKVTICEGTVVLK